MRKLNDNLILFESKINILLYKIKNEAYLIDSGNDKNLILEVLDYLKANNLNLKYIINTHSHADHTFYNDYLKEKNNCLVASTEIENIFIENSLKNNNHLYFKETKTSKLPNIPNLKYKKLEGHSYDMLGVLIENKYFFIADSIFSLKELNYFPFIYDISKFYKTLDKLLDYKDKIIISSHLGIIDNIDELYYLNKKYIIKTVGIIRSLIGDKIDVEELFLEF